MGGCAKKRKKAASQGLTRVAGSRTFRRPQRGSLARSDSWPKFIVFGAGLSEGVLYKLPGPRSLFEN
jgi:hypothetical protein